jgi:hypothetical protein
LAAHEVLDLFEQAVCLAGVGTGELLLDLLPPLGFQVELHGGTEEAAGGVTLERCGAILDERMTADE